MSLKKNTLWNLIGAGAPLIAAALCIPYTLRQLGEEGFGVLTLIWALIGYFNFFDFGAGRALTYEISRISNAGEAQTTNANASEIHRILKAGLALTLVTGTLGLAFIALCASSLAHHWLKISPLWQNATEAALQVTALGVIPATLTSGLRGAMEGLGRFRASNLNKIFIGFCMFLLPAIAIHFHGASLWHIALYLVVARFFALIYGCAQLKQHLWRSTPEPLQENTPPLTAQMRQLMSYGFWVTVTGIVSPLMVYGDRFFVSALVGADQLSIYAIPQEGLMRMLMVPIAICGALMPLFSTLSIAAEKRQHFEFHLKRMTKIMLGLCLLCLILIYPVLSVWISPAFARQAFPIALILVVGSFFNGIAVLPYTFLHANGKTKTTALFHLFELFFYLAILYLLAKNYGLIGAAAAWVIRVTLDWALLMWAARRELRSPDSLAASI